MPFLVYLMVLMAAISTVLLEVHWLTSPALVRYRLVLLLIKRARPARQECHESIELFGGASVGKHLCSSFDPRECGGHGWGDNASAP